MYMADNLASVVHSDAGDIFSDDDVIRVDEIVDPLEPAGFDTLDEPMACRILLDVTYGRSRCRSRFGIVTLRDFQLGKRNACLEITNTLPWIIRMLGDIQREIRMVLDLKMKLPIAVLFWQGMRYDRVHPS